LEEIEGVGRHTESNNVVVLADILESDQVIGLIAVKDKQPVTPNCTRCGVLNKVLQPSYTNFISSPAIIRYSYPPVLGVVVILALVVVLSLKDEER
jgi:hypothetical protein